MPLLLRCSHDGFFAQEEKIATRVTDPVNSVLKMDQVVNGAYWTMIGTYESGWNNVYDNPRVWNSLASDAFMITDPPHPRYQNQYGISYVCLNRYNRHQLFQVPDPPYRTEKPAYGTWLGCYSVISSANLVIEAYEDALPNVPFSNDENIEQLPRVVGEAYFLRGYHYWLLTQMYSPAYEPNGDNSAPSIMLKHQNSLGLSEVNEPQSSVEEVYQAMLADFDSAAANLPAYVGLGRASRPAAEAMLARLHLAMGNFEAAAENCTRVIENYSFSLEEEPIDAFNRQGPVESEEVIFEYEWNWSIPKGRQRSGFIGPIPSSHLQWVERRSFGFAGAIDTQLRSSAISHSLLQRIGWMDDQLSETQVAQRDKRYQQIYHRSEAGSDFRMEALVGSAFVLPYVWVFKDCRKSVNTDGGTDFTDELYNYYNNYPLIRLPEIYLTRAIARVRTGEQSGALQDLNLVRRRAWDDTFGPYQPISGGNLVGAASVEEAIEIERIKELLGEGDRLFYLKAMKMEVPPTEGGLPSVDYSDESLFWPLPLEEVDLNEAVN